VTDAPGGAKVRLLRQPDERAVAKRQELDRAYSTNLPRHLMDVSQALNRRLLEHNAALGHRGLKMSFATVMSHAGFPGARLSDIAAMNGLSKQAISQTARELADLGYIELLPDPEDARARLITLTERGRALIADSLRSLDAVEAEAEALIGSERFALFRDIAAELWDTLGRRSASQANDAA
jgi:DNA-binding MarR family transcriptional regulator